MALRDSTAFLNPPGTPRRRSVRFLEAVERDLDFKPGIREFALERPRRAPPASRVEAHRCSGGAFRLFPPAGEGEHDLEQIGAQRRLAARQDEMAQRRREARGEFLNLGERKLRMALVELAPAKAMRALRVAAHGDIEQERLERVSPLRAPRPPVAPKAPRHVPKDCEINLAQWPMLSCAEAGESQPIHDHPH